MLRIVKQDRERYKLDLESEGIKYEVLRLDSSEYISLRHNSMPIKDYNFHFNLYFRKPYGCDNELYLAELMVILEWLLGKSSALYDDWKCGFSFPTLLVIKKNEETYFYLMHIYDFRGSIEFHFYKVIEGTLEKPDDTDVIRQPFPEFDEEDIRYFTSYFYGYLVEYYRTVKSILPKKNFLKAIDSNHIIYGCEDGEFFQEYYDSSETYQAEIKAFKEKYEPPSHKESITDIIKQIRNGL